MRLAGYIVVLAVLFLFSNMKLIAADTFTPVYNLSVVYAEKGQCGEAIKILKELLKGRENSPSLHFNLGVCYYKEGLSKEAIYEFKKVLSLSPDDYNSHFNLGIIYYEKKDYKKAREHFRRALEINDKDPLVRCWVERVGK